jgi:hypothetical protein
MIYKNNEVNKRLDFYKFIFKITQFQEGNVTAILPSNSPADNLVSPEKIIAGSIFHDFSPE